MKTISERLAKELTHFHENPNDRCIKDGKCRYHGSSLGLNVRGCLIGRMLPEKVAKAIDKKFDTGVGIYTLLYEGEEFMPKYFYKTKATLLVSFQELHDFDDFWDDNGLNDDGIGLLNRLIDSYDKELDRADFEHIIG